MKTIAATTILFVSITVSGFAQSKSFRTLQDKFSDDEEVYCFHTSGFLARTVLWVAVEQEFTKAIKDIENMSLITVPKSAFASKGVSVSGYKAILRKNLFEELAHVDKHGDHVTLYMKSIKNGNSRYMILIEEPGTVVVIEFEGYVDPNLMLKHEKLSYNERQAELEF